MASGTWYYVENDQSIGPLDAGEIERLIDTGTIRPNTAVWTDGMDEWEPAQSHFSFATTRGGARTGPPDVAHSARGTGAGGLYVGAPARGFKEAVSVCFSKYVGFSGRASRSEYWYWVLFTMLAGIVTAFLDVMIFGANTEASPLNSLFSLATFLPGLAVAFRRLHDINRSGWWLGGYFLAFVVAGVLVALIAETSTMANMPNLLLALIGIGAVIYSIVLLVFMCTKGDPGPNDYG